MMKRLEHLSCKDRLRELGLVCIEKKKSQGDLIHMYKYLIRKVKTVEPTWCSMRTRENSEIQKIMFKNKKNVF